ncbi:WYL domain-containing protein [Enterococcus hulanensis]|uniref:WYL domain-containing protein n=1 Tax=Enterococcus hulanensis TaxID=2559929 RepID=A0ABU3F467_9ENTE|nr:WYL domain-containing protein [Enterococcus hulanensis]MDT2600946.1 WYL domain-containing protein [Enterococcus hulanensis]MDT2611534.1 WYL domain-containing protein [Enterococcus hulanensis]MDT2617981.1 WYL domain-containing protein [Enterococcus hulanensis]MDT2628984.1 WYL domain-containing protein [Enterococcus hulanensis]MDT2656546.1 WYL domain-containing protein [Enterococcus hulanensis]
MNSNQRIMNIFLSLYQGESLSIKESSIKYETSIRTIQRDLATISNALHANGLKIQLIISPTSGDYSLKRMDHISPQELLVLGKILLESRALTKNEIEKVINHILDELSEESSKIIKQSLANELLSYYPLKHQENLLQLIWDFSTYITEQTVLTFTYQKNRGEVVQRKGLPVSLFFSEYYFYVILYNPTYKSYLNYRLDRFLDIQSTSEKIKIDHKDRLEDRQLRKKIHFMYAGKEVTFTFRFWGIIEAALDKLPDSKVIKEYDDNSVVIEATAYDTGVIMWLLSQGSNVQVLSPPSFVEKVKKEVEDMQKRYLN